MLRDVHPVSRAGFLALTLVIVTLGVPAPGMAQSAAGTPAANTTESAQATPQGKFIQNLGDKAIAILADNKITPDQRDVKFREMLRETFDLATIGRFVIGRSWNAATPDQQKEYMHLFEELVVKTYSDRFALYTGEGFKVRAVHPEGEKDFIVNSDITHPDGSPPTTVDWRLRQKGDKLGIIDVVVEGVSMSVTQRQEYASVIQRNGGNIDGLLDVMRDHLKNPANAHPNNG
jgi:phospholipid transport system substrate-binding protein